MLFVIAAAAAGSESGPVLWYGQAAEEWEEALPVGNGRLGAMVFGKSRRERIQLNEDTIWAGSPQERDMVGAHEHLAEIRRLLFQKDFATAGSLVQENLLSGESRHKSYQVLGDLSIDFGTGAAGGYRRQLDLETGIALTEWTRNGARFTTEVFASVPHDVLVVRIEADSAEKVSVGVGLSRRAGATAAASGREVVLIGRASHGEEHLGVSFEARVRVVAEGGSVSVQDGGLSISGADAATLFVAVATDYGDAVIAGETSRDVAAAEEAGYEAVREAHVEEHRPIFNRVRLKLGSAAPSSLATDVRLRRVQAGTSDADLVATLFQYGRYLLMASSRPGTMPANLRLRWWWRRWWFRRRR